MMRFLVVVAMVLALNAAGVGAQAEPDPGKFRANVKPEVTQLNPEDFIFLGKYFSPRPGPRPSFDWCWSQKLRGKAGQVPLRGDWVFCGGEAQTMADPFFAPMGPDYYGILGVIRTPRGDIYTLTSRSSAWQNDSLEAFGGVTRFFGGTGEFNHAMGWTTDRPKEYPPTSWMWTNGLISFLGPDSDDHPAYWPDGYDVVTRLEFPAREPGNIEKPGDYDYFLFETKEGWRYSFGTTLGTLDDSLIKLDHVAEGPDICNANLIYEDDQMWDGEGSYLGDFTAVANCTFVLEVMDWGRAGTSHTGTYTVWGNEYLP